jgi:hypothetical protein
MRRLPLRIITSMALGFCLISSSVVAEESEQIRKRRKIFESLSQEMAGGAMELKELEIRAKIYEPQVVYILDRSRIEVHFKEDALHFSPRIHQVVEDNRF